MMWGPFYDCFKIMTELLKNISIKNIKKIFEVEIKKKNMIRGYTNFLPGAGSFSQVVRISIKAL